MYISDATVKLGTISNDFLIQPLFWFYGSFLGDEDTFWNFLTFTDDIIDDLMDEMRSLKKEDPIYIFGAKFEISGRDIHIECSKQFKWNL